jgi:hypothetical protein
MGKESAMGGNGIPLSAYQKRMLDVSRAGRLQLVVGTSPAQPRYFAPELTHAALLATTMGLDFSFDAYA